MTTPATRDVQTTAQNAIDFRGSLVEVWQASLDYGYRAFRFDLGDYLSVIVGDFKVSPWVFTQQFFLDAGDLLICHIGLL